MSKIQWTEMTWNPIVGCSIVSPGCTHCYAMNAAWRMAHNPSTPQYAGTVEKVNDKPVWTGKIGFNEKARFAPLKRKKPTMYFVNSMGDLFHEDVPDAMIDHIFAVMALSPQHTFQVLTKRAERMRDYFSDMSVANRIFDVAAVMMAIGAWNGADLRRDALLPLPNVWLGVSVEDQKRANERIPALLRTPAAVRFVSAEPLLGAIDFESWLAWPDEPLKTGGYDWGCVECEGLNPCEHCPKTRAVYHCDEGSIDADGCPDYVHCERVKLDWIIVGGESGPGARRCNIDQIQSIVDQCQNAGVPVFVKQLGAQAFYCSGKPLDLNHPKGGDMAEWPEALRLRQMPGDV